MEMVMQTNRNQTIWSAILIGLLWICTPYALEARHGWGGFGWGLGVGLGVGLGYPYGYRGYYYGGYPYYYEDYYRPAYTRYNTYYVSPSYSSVQYTTITNNTDQIMYIQSEYENYKVNPDERQEIKGYIKTIRSEKGQEIEIKSHRFNIQIYFDRDGRLGIR